MLNLVEMSSETKKYLFYPNLPVTMKPVPHNDILSVPDHYEKFVFDEEKLN